MYNVNQTENKVNDVDILGKTDENELNILERVWLETGRIIVGSIIAALVIMTPFLLHSLIIHLLGW